MATKAEKTSVEEKPEETQEVTSSEAQLNNGDGAGEVQSVEIPGATDSQNPDIQSYDERMLSLQERMIAVAALENKRDKLETAIHEERDILKKNTLRDELAELYKSASSGGLKPLSNEEFKELTEWQNNNQETTLEIACQKFTNTLKEIISSAKEDEDLHESWKEEPAEWVKFLNNLAEEKAEKLLHRKTNRQIRQEEIENSTAYETSMKMAMELPEEERKGFLGEDGKLLPSVVKTFIAPRVQDSTEGKNPDALQDIGKLSLPRLGEKAEEKASSVPQPTPTVTPGSTTNGSLTKGANKEPMQSPDGKQEYVEEGIFRMFLEEHKEKLEAAGLYPEKLTNGTNIYSSKPQMAQIIQKGLAEGVIPDFKTPSPKKYLVSYAKSKNWDFPKS